MARQTVEAKIEFSGPFFQKDPVKTFRQNVRVLMDSVAASGETYADAQLAAGESERAPMRGITPVRVRGHVVGRTSNTSGKRWAVTAVVSPLNARLTPAAAKTLMAAASRIEGRTKVFSRTARKLRGERNRLMDEMAKGLN